MPQYKLDPFSSEKPNISNLESPKLLKDSVLWDDFRNGADAAFIQIVLNGNSSDSFRSGIRKGKAWTIVRISISLYPMSNN